jgi:hypothetical protein
MAIVVKPMANATGHRIAEEENRLMCRVDPVDKAFFLPVNQSNTSLSLIGVMLSVDKRHNIVQSAKIQLAHHEPIERYLLRHDGIANNGNNRQCQYKQHFQSFSHSAVLFRILHAGQHALRLQR